LLKDYGGDYFIIYSFLAITCKSQMLDVGSMALKMRIFEKQKITPCIFQVPVASSKNPLTPIHA